MRRDPKRIPVTLVLIAINVIIYGIACFMSGELEPSRRVMVTLGASAARYVDRGDYWRLFTAMFLHWSPSHLAMNMFSLYAIGADLEMIIKSGWYLLVYILSGLGGSILSVTMNKNALAAGASGAIFGLIGGMIVVALILRDRIGNSLLINLVVITAFNLMMGFSPGSGIDNMAHIGGLITGFVATMIIVLSIRGRARKY